MRRNLVIGLAGLLVAGAAGTGAEVAAGDDDDGTVTGPAAERAIAAALSATDGGRANSVERDSEDGAVWEVEVTRRDGSTVDVRLDGDLRVVVIEGDHEDDDSGNGSDD
jgi:uncharacterized membrane protein YkoI